MSQTKAQLIDTLVASLLPASDSSVDLGSNAVRFANIYGDTLYGSGANLTALNIVTDTSPQLGNSLDMNGQSINGGDSAGVANNRIKLGAGDDLQIYHDGSNSYIKDAGTGQLRLATNEFLITNAAVSENMFKIFENGAVELYYDASKKFETASYGALVSGNLDATGNIVIPNDTGKFLAGASNDLQIYHDSANSLIDEVGTGILGLRSDTGINLYKLTGNEFMLKAIPDGGVELYHNNSKKFETTSAGVSVAGTITSTDSANVADGHVLCQLDSGNGRLKLLSGSDAITVDIQGSVGNVKIVDDGKFQAGDSNDLQIYHDGSHSNIINSTGVLKVRGVAGQSITFRNGDDSANVAVFNIDDATHLYFDSAHKFSTTSTGIRVIGNCVPSGNDTGQLGTTGTRWQELNISDVIDIKDNGRIRVGDSDDLQIYHDGSGTYLDNSTGNLENRSDEFRVKSLSGSNEAMIQASYQGDVQLWYDGNKKLETESYGVLVTGELRTTDDIRIQSNYPRLFLTDTDNNNDYSLINNNGNFLIYDDTNNLFRMRIDGATGTCTMHWRPGANNTYDLGTSSFRWANIYTNDLNLSNEGGTNDIDGTWGSYTIQEGAEDLFLVNRRNGKKYKFNLTEVS